MRFRLNLEVWIFREFCGISQISDGPTAKRMKIDQYCQRQRCKHVKLEQFLACFRVARVCQRQLGFLVFTWGWDKIWKWTLKKDISVISWNRAFGTIVSALKGLKLDEPRKAVNLHRCLHSVTVQSVPLEQTDGPNSYISIALWSESLQGSINNSRSQT